MNWLVSDQRQLLAAPAGLDALLYSYGVYTTFRLPLTDTWLHAHLDRLRHDADVLCLACEHLADGATREALLETFWQVYEPENPVFRLSCIADAGSYGDFDSRKPLPGRLFISTRPVPGTRDAVCLKSITYRRPIPGIKLGAIAELLHFRRTLPPGYDDVLLTGPEGVMAETGTANVFFIRDDGLLTPDPARDGCLPGITRRRVLAAAEEQGLPVSTDVSLILPGLATFSGAFLANAVQGLVPVSQIDEIRFPWPESARQLLKNLQIAITAER